MQVLRMDWKGEVGSSETREEVVGLLQRKLWEPEFWSRAGPRAKLEHVPEAVLSHPWEAEWIDLDSGRKSDTFRGGL